MANEFPHNGSFMDRHRRYYGKRNICADARLRVARRDHVNEAYGWETVLAAAISAYRGNGARVQHMEKALAYVRYSMERAKRDDMEEAAGFLGKSLGILSSGSHPMDKALCEAIPDAIQYINTITINRDKSARRALEGIADRLISEFKAGRALPDCSSSRRP